MDLEGEIDRLYGLDRDAFVAERDSGVRRFRGEGDREGAERLRALRKPTVAAWAVNRLARDRPGEVRDLLSSVDELGVAQAQAVKGDPGRFREAAEAHRGAIEGLVDAAQRILEEADSASAATVERVRETLHAVSVDPQARELLRAGRLDRERQPGGLDALGLAGAVPVEEAQPEETAVGQGSAREEARGKETAVGQGSAREEARGKETAVGRAAAQEDAQRARAASRKARDAVRAAERRTESARRRLERAEAAAAKADAAREEARLAFQEAEREHEGAARRELELRAEG